MNSIKAQNLQPIAALSIAALALFVPANLYPIMTMQYMGLYKEVTIYDGVLSMFNDGMWFTAVIVFLASIVIPVVKIVGLLTLVILAHTKRERALAFRLHGLIDRVGRWSMLDVFLLAIMVAMIKFGSFATVTLGVGSIVFTIVVLLTMLASALFDRDISLLQQEQQNDA